MLTAAVLTPILLSSAATLALVALHTRGTKLPILEALLNWVVVSTDDDPNTKPDLNGLADLILSELRKRLPHPDDTKPKDPQVQVVNTEAGQTKIQVTLPK